MTESGYLLLGLNAIVAALVGVLAFAVTKFIVAARSVGKEREPGAETAFMAAAMEQAMQRLRSQERALKARAEASERLSEEIIASLTSGLLVVDSDRAVRTLNPAGRRMLGLPETGVLAKIPASLGYAEAAAIPNGALTALVYLRNLGAVRPGERVLVHGASGSVGTAAVQLAKVFGAHVTAVCSTPNLDLVQTLGADAVIDYTTRDFRDSGRYDLVFDTIGRTTWHDVQASLAPRGRYLVTVFGFLDSLRMLWTWLARGRRILGTASNFHWCPAQLDFLASLVEDGRFEPVIDRCYPFDQAAEAHRYVEAGHKRGNVVLLLDHAESSPARRCLAQCDGSSARSELRTS